MLAFKYVTLGDRTLWALQPPLQAADVNHRIRAGLFLGSSMSGLSDKTLQLILMSMIPSELFNHELTCEEGTLAG